MRSEVEVVLGRLGQRHVLGLADRDADRDADRQVAAGHPGSRQPVGQGLGAAVVEAHPVDDRRAAGQPEQPRPVVAWLGLRGHRAELDEAEARARPRSRCRSPSLSIPAASPTRPGNWMPATLTGLTVPSTERGECPRRLLAAPGLDQRPQRLLVHPLGIAAVRPEQQSAGPAVR